MPIRYKVVKSRTRNSAIINGNSHYARKYLPGTIVVAEEGTLGIMTFESKISAEKWADNFNFRNWRNGHNIRMKVIQVEGIGRGHSPVWLANGLKTEDLDLFYNPEVEVWTTNNIAPDDTICYKSIRVLE